jgi:hypothetical protein
MPRTLLVLAALTLWIFTVSCASRTATYKRPQRITGTCAGACEHYLSCKGDSRQRSYDACLRSCPFAQGESAAAFEQLTCDAAIGFVEGDGGREPGRPASATSKVSR